MVIYRIPQKCLDYFLNPAARLYRVESTLLIDHKAGEAAKYVDPKQGSSRPGSAINSSGS